MKSNLLFLLSILVMVGCKNEKETPLPDTKQEITEFNMPDWAKNAVIYEINTRQFSPEGNFVGIEEQLYRIASMGVDILWLMPIHPISELKRKATGDTLVDDIKDPTEKAKYFGSPYAVANYKEVNPHYGTMDEFKSLLKATHDKGMRLIIDWVPNHTGWDNPWIFDHPEWYTQDKDGNIIDPIDYNTGKSWGWTDVADLNYDNKEMRKEMVETMVYWVKDIGIDGFRVDVAHGIAQDFWDECSPQVLEAKPDAFLLAESEVESHRNNNTFHATYGWSFHHLLNDIAKGNKTAAAIDEWRKEDAKKFTKGFHMHFTSNHDENTWAGTVFERMGDAHKAMAVLTSTLEGMPLLYSGMEEPMKKRLPFFTKEFIGFKEYAYTDFYTKLFNLKERNQALWNGSYGGEATKILDHEHVYAFKREKNGQSVISILNLSKEEQSISLSEEIKGKELFSGEQIHWEKESKLDLAPWQYYVLEL